MKKVELHLHFDGSINVDYANKIKGRDIKREMIGSGSKTLKEYLDKFQLPIELLQDIENIEHFSYLLGKELENDEVIYAEVRFCPLFHVEKYSISQVVEAMKRGFDKVSTVSVNFIFCMMRHFPFEKNLEIINLTKSFLGHGVSGIDLAGDEGNFETVNFSELFKIIKQNNIPFTIHAGEADSYESVNWAIDYGAKRIGHGIRSVESGETIKNLIEKNVVLEVCPTSNVDTHVISSIDEHPIKKLVDAGVLVTINTDNRTVSHTSLKQEYKILHETFGFSKDDFKKFNLNAIEAAFIDDDLKKKLRNEILEDYD